MPCARTRDLPANVTGTHLSVGTLVEWVRQSAETLEPVDASLWAASLGVCGQYCELTPYEIHAKRGSEATSEIGTLPGCRGVSVHDGWKPYQAHTACCHALCNVHHLRAL